MNKEQCEQCGDEKEMYYRQWCPRCEKPTTKTIRSLNLMQCLRYISRVYFPHEKENDRLDTTERKVWLIITDEYAFKGNDSFFSLPFVYYVNGEWEQTDPDVKLFFEKLVEEFELDTDEGENIIWEVSW